MDLNALKSQLDTTESQLSQYTANLPSEIETQIQNAYTPALEKSLGTTKDMMSDYLGRYFDTTTMGPGMAGTTALDLSPTQKLGVMGRELGTMSGELQATQKFSDYLGGQMNDLYGKAVQAAQLGQQNLADQYARQMQEYQMAWQAAEAEKDRALQRAQIASQNAYNNKLLQLQQDQLNATNKQNALATWQQNVDAIKANRGTFGGNTLNSYHKALLKEAQDLGIGVDSEQLWVMMGNAPKQAWNTSGLSVGEGGGGSSAGGW
jgi:hypothetical protein